MTRADVTAIVSSPERVTIPTLALNLPEGVTALPKQMRIFSLALDFEARLVARSAFAEGGPEARIVHSPSGLSKRSRDAFVDAWTHAGGRISEVLEVDPKGDPATTKSALQQVPAEVVLLAADPEEARIIRPLLPGQPRVYGTSQVHAARSTQSPPVQLEGLRFVEMPWFVTPTSPEVSSFRRPQGLSPDLERIYALGIDSFRLAAAMFEATRLFTFNGVTGRISMTNDPIVERLPVAAQFRRGSISVVEVPR